MGRVARSRDLLRSGPAAVVDGGPRHRVGVPGNGCQHRGRRVAAHLPGRVRSRHRVKHDGVVPDAGAHLAAAAAHSAGAGGPRRHRLRTHQPAAWPRPHRRQLLPRAGVPGVPAAGPGSAGHRDRPGGGDRQLHRPLPRATALDVAHPVPLRADRSARHRVRQFRAAAAAAGDDPEADGAGGAGAGGAGAERRGRAHGDGASHGEPPTPQPRAIE